MEKICKICGKSFETKSSRRLICYDRHIKNCVICGQPFEVISSPFTQKICSKKSCKAEYARNTTCKDNKVCEYCGKEFIPSSPRQKYCAGPHYGKCPNCGKQVEIKNLHNNVPCCSLECTQKLREQTMLSKYGVPNAMQSDIVKETVTANNIEKYGVPYVFQTDNFKRKAKETMVNKYGVEFAAQSRVSRYKFNLTCLDRYGVEEPLTSEEIRERISKTIQQKYGVPWYCMSEDYHKFQTIISKINREFGKLLESYNIPYKFEKRIENRSYDIEILNQNVLIEINPTITHNSYLSIFDETSSGLTANYHRDKLLLAESYGYRCINIFDWDDAQKVVNLLLGKEKIFARQCQIDYISLEECDAFLSEFHLQGSCKNQKVRLGLYYHDELVQVMTFGTPRYNKNYEWELLRLCSKSDLTIAYGPERLFKHFIKTYSPASIISYCDRSKFSGYVYRKLGMELKTWNSPSKIWSKDNKYIRDSLLRARGYDQLFNTDYGKGSNNENLMLEHQWLPVYDCGQAVYVYTPRSYCDECEV